MVVSPFRALLAARVQLLWNVAHRGRGALGTISAIVIVCAAVACLVPPFLMFVTFGTVLGEDLASPGSPSLTWLAGLHALLVLGLGAMAGLRHQAGFDRTVLRAFPLRPLQVLLAELPFNLIDTIPVLGCVMFAGLGIGLARSAPDGVAHATLTVAQGMLGILLVQQLVGALRRLVSRSRSLMALAAAGAALGGALVFLAARRGLAEGLGLVLAWWPTSAGHHALRAALLDEPGRAWGFQAASLAWTLALFLLTLWLQFKEMDLDPPEQAERRLDERVWTFATPDAGVARLLATQVAGSRAGLVQLVLPLFGTGMLVLAADIVRRSAAGRDPSGLHLTAHSLAEKLVELPLFAIVPPAVVLLGRELWMNQFAWSGGGVKTLLLAPLRTTRLLEGHLKGLLLLQVPQALLACAPLFRLRMPREWELLTGLASALACAVVLATAGHVLSARFPRVISVRGDRSDGVPASLALAGTALVAGLAGVLIAVVRGLSASGGWAPAAALGGLCGAALVVRRILAARIARVVDAHRETLAETLG